MRFIVVTQEYVQKAGTIVVPVFAWNKRRFSGGNAIPWGTKLFFPLLADAGFKGAVGEARKESIDGISIIAVGCGGKSFSPSEARKWAAVAAGHMRGDKGGDVAVLLPAGKKSKRSSAR